MFGSGNEQCLQLYLPKYCITKYSRSHQKYGLRSFEFCLQLLQKMRLIFNRKYFIIFSSFLVLAPYKPKRPIYIILWKDGFPSTLNTENYTSKLEISPHQSKPFLQQTLCGYLLVQPRYDTNFLETASYHNNCRTVIHKSALHCQQQAIILLTNSCKLWLPLFSPQI